MRTYSRLVVDTTIIVALSHRGQFGRYLTFHYPELTLPAFASPITISFVTVAEVLSIAARNTWRQERKDFLHSLLNQFRIITIDSPGILEAYVEIDVFSLKSGRNMGKNDLWIAATASATNTTLLTTDKDFDDLDPGYLSLIWIDPKSAT